MKKVIGRENEIEILNNALKSDSSELIAVYGRRRVGKTFLIRSIYESRIRFEFTGLFGGSLKEQLENFAKQLRDWSGDQSMRKPKYWLEAFWLLEGYLNKVKGKGKKVIFIDEFPWASTPRSNFIMAFGSFWNSYVTKRRDLVVVICGSSASYMIRNVLRNRGGLYNRVTQKIRLLPFNLYETQLFLKSKNIKYTKYDIIQLYMAMGGIPHYLEKIVRGDSVAQNIDKLCFAKDGFLNAEFNQLLASLFSDSEMHVAIIKALASAKRGVSRKALIKKSKVSSGGGFSLKLEELIESGFVTEYRFHNNWKQQSLFRLTDEYALFYLKYIEKNKEFGAGTWNKLSSSQSYKSWSGFGFETICLKHIKQIKRGLGIESIYSFQSSWFNDEAQIDLLIDRDDNIINVCEIKFSKDPFTISKSYYPNLRNKLHQFKMETKTRKNVFLTMITTFGVVQNQYSFELMQSQLTMDALFVE